MCGIAGLFRFSLPPDQVAESLGRMADALVHRGPDARTVTGIREIGGGLAVARLSIVDVVSGTQPASNEDRTIFVALNGEIYNHVELRKLLSERGHRFGSCSDTEVIAHLYEDRGPDCLRDLEGMFGLAVIDTKKRTLLLARDGPGMKPLYVVETGAGVAFASEAKALFAGRVLSARPSPAGLNVCLAAGFVPAPLTMFEGVSRLAAGEYLFADVSGKVERKRFWQYSFKQEKERTEDEYAEELDHLLGNAVRAHLSGDVPVGALVSGGWDSSLVATFAAAACPKLKTFSIIFPDDPANDESRYSRLMARTLGSDHHEIEYRSALLPEALPRIVRHLEEPAMNVPVGVFYRVAYLASQHVKTAMGGEGADELFGGYEFFTYTLPYRVRRLVPSWLARPFVGVPMPARLEKGIRFLAAADGRMADAEFHREWTVERMRTVLNPEYCVEGPDLLPALVSAEVADTCCDLLDRRLAYHLKGRLPESILFALDKMGMSHSLEVRMPFLDRRVIEFAGRLPSRYKNDGKTAKLLFRSIAKKRLPAEIAARKKKGLAYPIGEWEKPEIKRYIESVLLDSRHQGPFRQDAVEKILQGRAGSPVRNRALRTLIMLQLWWLEFIEAM